MKLAVFDTHEYDREALAAANGRYGHELSYLEPRLTQRIADTTLGNVRAFERGECLSNLADARRRRSPDSRRLWSLTAKLVPSTSRANLSDGDRANSRIRHRRSG